MFGPLLRLIHLFSRIPTPVLGFCEFYVFHGCLEVLFVQRDDRREPTVQRSQGMSSDGHLGCIFNRFIL